MNNYIKFEEFEYLMNENKIHRKSIALSLFLAFAIIGTPVLLSIKTSHAIAPATFPPPILYQLKDIPSYAITIPYSSQGNSHFEPGEVNIPLGMTVIWFNNDHAYHTVTTLSNSSYSPPEKFDSKFIPVNGGSFIHHFNKAGIYDYFDQQHPSNHGRIIVTTGMEKGKNMNMLIGGYIPFSASNLARDTFRFVPTSISLPPAIGLTYNITLLDSKGKPIFSHNYDDADGILDLELIPMKSNTTKISSSDFTTWGPDFSSQESYRTTGTFHIQGPVLVKDSPYSIKVDIVEKGNKIISHPVSDVFPIPPKLNVTAK